MSTLIPSASTSAFRPLSYDDMLEYFRAGCKPRSRWRVGAEFEKLGVERLTGRQRTYAEPDGIREILERLSSRFGWRAICENGNITSLVRDGACISIEPGAQVELALPPSQSLVELESGLRTHLAELFAVSGDSTMWIAAGVTPCTSVDRIPLVPRARYHVMSQYLPTRSSTALQMMKATASTQAAFDFSDEADAMRKFEFALRASPFVNAICSNSPIYAGEPSLDISQRARIWEQMDPDRSGLLLHLMKECLSFESWLNYLLDVPMMFVCIDGAYQPANGITFRQFADVGIDGRFPTHQDWEIHVTTVFPEARLKRYLEVRGADAANVSISMGTIAIWKGILYSDSALDVGLELVRAIDDGELLALRNGIRREGLGTQVGVWHVKEVCRKIVDLAESGLANQARESGIDDRKYLQPIHEIVDSGLSPGERFLATEFRDVGDLGKIASWFGYGDPGAIAVAADHSKGHAMEFHDGVMI